MTERLTAALGRWLTRIWLSIAFVVGLLPVALVDRMRRRADFVGPDADADSYWLRRDPEPGDLDVRSNDSMIITIRSRSAAASYLAGTRSPSRLRALSGAVCLAVLRPIRRLTPDEDEQYLDPSIYPMY